MSRILHKRVLSSRFMAGLTPILLLGCSTVPMSPGTALAQSDSVAREMPSGDSGMDSQLMFELMISELAGRRGQLDVAMAGYLRAAGRTDDPRVSERATRLAMFGRQWEEAEAAARRWLSLDPDAQVALPLMAQALMHQGKLDDAAEVYVQIVQTSDDQDQALRQVYADVRVAEKTDNAVSIMQQVARAFSDNAQSHLGLARLQLQANDRSAALLSVDKTLELDGAEVSALLLRAQILSALGRPEEGLSRIKSVLDAGEGQQSLRMGYAQLLAEAGRYDEVGEQLDSLYRSSGDDQDVLLTIAMLALDARRIEQARTYLADLLEKGVYPDQANFYLARISDQQKDYQQAIAYYDAVEPGELQLTARIRAAELVGISGDVEQGRERLRSMASSLEDQAMRPRLITAESRMLQTAGQANEAVLVLTEGLAEIPDNEDLLYARALAANAADDINLMMADLNRLIEKDPDNAHALNALGYHLADSNVELDRAEELLVKANQLLPDDPAIMDSLGWLRYRQGRFDEAITLLKAAYAMFPDAEIAAHLGEALWLNGNEQEARKLIEEALVESPDDERLIQVMKQYGE